jgi:hypothetical protein
LCREAPAWPVDDPGSCAAECRVAPPYRRPRFPPRVGSAAAKRQYSAPESLCVS